MIALTNAYGFSCEPFGSNIPIDQLFPLPGLKPFLDRFDYAVHLGAVTVITGEVGAGKSTSLRAASARLHPAQYKLITLIATTGSMGELLRQICLELGTPEMVNSSAKLFKAIRNQLQDICQKKLTPVMIIDEAHLIRTEVFSQLHTLVQVPFDTQSLTPMVLSGQTTLIDKLLYHTARPFASRVLGRTHLEGLQLKDMQAYLLHHLKIAGGKAELLSDEAITAIHQSSGGLLRRANLLARGAFLAATQENCPTVTAEHVRIASTEIL
jgi:general secretion pathway protein A